MLKSTALLFVVLCFFSIKTNAQIADSLRRADSLRVVDSLKRVDTVKIDTNLLNRYRINISKFRLPIPVKPFKVEPNLIPVSLLDYKVSYWRKWIIFGLNFNQAAFSDNWAAGGVNSLALSGNFDYKTEYQKGSFDYTGELLLLYGRARNAGSESRKTNDRIFFDNKFSSQLSKTWFFFGSVSFESQFDKGFTYFDDGVTPPALISRFMAPGYLTESVGVEYKPSKVFDLRLGTGTARQTFVLDTTIYHNQPANYGVTPGKTFLNELAFQAVAIFDKNIATNMHLNTRYTLFIPYARLPENIDHRLDVVLTANVNKLIAVTINGTALYDKNTSERIQASESLALGVIYKFP
ncbi:DUF3078 domain-containing protein [Mucilaginibacter ginkgonis]|uniref:DUF3078 domain-containing protein n=1 Tax=Mucilaginibacter ginkgonis TaxID=2682091 RepID=A0A6I4I2X0_9SPHI|nr:DUF3078 domain-containing protein [Mucilaginibacter ginkgonis]QQL49637.1 DUF3078 domain-containing protein [Mucilaginibacter ginkgonis]